MLAATELKVNTIFVYNDEPCRVLEYRHTHMARGSADVRLKIKGLISNNVIPLVLTPSSKFEKANLIKKPKQFLYKEGQTLHFMDPENFEQIELDAENMSDSVVFLQEGETYDVLYWDDQALDVMVPPKVDVEVLECDPGVKGNSAANMYKSAEIVGGIQIKVPLFIEKGEKIRVDTVNRKYVERAK